MDPLAAARGLAPLVEDLRGGFDRDGALPVTLVDALRDAGIYRLWLPRAEGGAELEPVPFLMVLEELARQDGSFGWCAAIASGYGRLSGALTESASRTVFGTGRGILAGTLNPSGKARAVPGGYQVTGRWPYGSFIGYADWVLGNCVTEDESGPRRSADGGPDLRLCLVPRDSVTVFDVWHTGGLRATGSNDYEMTDLFVPEDHTVPLINFQPRPIRPGPLYAIPMTSTFVSCISVVILGMARAALDELVRVAATKTTSGTSAPLREKSVAQVDLARAEARLGAGRAFLFDELGTMWRDVEAGRPIEMAARARVRLAAVQAAQWAIEATDLAYQMAGGLSLFAPGRLDRCFRDIHAGAQHVALSPHANLEPIGRVLFGLPPGLARF
jgi:indole-3-acetate monooxygenase